MAISQQELDDLAYLTQEERCARDVYAVFFAKYNKSIWTTIGDSESTHIASILAKAVKYGANPGPDVPGTYINSHIQEAYNAAIAKGNLSLTDAYQVSAGFEQMDIDDIGRFMANSKQNDVKMVLNNLLAGSFSHLDSFNGALGL